MEEDINMGSPTNTSKITISLKKAYRDHYEREAERQGGPMPKLLRERLEEEPKGEQSKIAERAILGLYRKAQEKATEAREAKDGKARAEALAVSILALQELEAIAGHARELANELKRTQGEQRTQ